jgi:hypothetical protein
MKSIIIFRDITLCSPLKANRYFGGTYRYLANGILLVLFEPEHGGDMFLRNVSWLLTDYTALYSEDRTLHLSCSLCKQNEK